MDTTAQLNERFAPGGAPLEPDVVVQLQSIMTMHGLLVEELFFKWEAYCIKMERDAGAVPMEALRAFKQDLQNALERRNHEAAAHAPTLHRKKAEAGSGGGMRIAATPRNAAKTGDVFGLLDIPSTPGSGKSSAKKKVATPVARIKSEHAGSSPDPRSGGGSPFNERQHAGDVVEVLNPQLAAAEAPIVPHAASRVKLTAASDLKKLGYKPLAMKLSEASEILDDRIDEFMSVVMAYHGIEYEAFGSAASQSTAEIVAVGRIASDAPEGKLNAASLVLETSRRMGGGLRVPLDLGRLQGAGYAFFPGQIVALRGTNASGHAFAVSQVLELPLLPNAASTREALAVHRQRLGGEDGTTDEPPPLTLLFAAGPYTADDNLDYEPLHALCSLAADAGVDAVVLAGPFVDADHPLIATGDFDLPEEAAVDADAATLSAVFRWLVAPALQRLAAANPAVTVLLVPSVRDVLDKHVSWPQDAFPKKRELGLPKAQVRVVGNPMTLSVNEMVLGVSTQDVLYELRHEEIAGGRLAEADVNAVARACRHLLAQRHYFPVFPPVDRRQLPRSGVADTDGLATGAMLDPSYLRLGEMVNVRPDVLLLPSALPPFAKVVESVLVINPGALSKRRGPGTYARMTLHPPPALDGGDSADMVGHGIFERARVEITRI